MTQVNGTSGIILAGGAGRRMGGKDKGLVMWRGLPLVEHVYRRLAPQVDNILISCNRNQTTYERLAPTVTDTRSGYEGPLAGIEAAAQNATGSILLIVACDAPLLPLDLASRLAGALHENPEGLDIAYANDGTRSQYLFAAVRDDRIHQLTTFLNQGKRAVGEWMSTVRSAAIDFSDQPDAFANINELQGAE